MTGTTTEEVVTTETETETEVAQTPEAGDDDFAAGFDGTASTPTETPAEETVAEPETKEPEPESPKFAQITEDDYQALVAKASLVDELKAAQEKQFGTAFGKIGGIERTLNQIRENMNANGGTVTFTDEDFAGMEFPEVARGIAQKLAEKVKPGGAVAAIDPGEIEKVASQAAQRERANLHREILDGMFEGWDQIIGLPDENNVIPETDYRKWLKTQPAEYQAKINNSNNAFEIGQSVSKYKQFAETERAKAEAAATRKERFTAAVTPKGSGGHAPTRTEDDDFEAGFNS